jgi:hypothetical protein
VTRRQPTPELAAHRYLRRRATGSGWQFPKLRPRTWKSTATATMPNADIGASDSANAAREQFGQDARRPAFLVQQRTAREEYPGPADGTVPLSSA